MDTEAFQDELRCAFPPSVRAAILSRLTTAAKNAADDFQPEKGWNAHLYAMASFHFACFESEKMVDAELPADIERIPRPSPLDLKLRFNNFKTAIHRVGWTADDPIEACFPTSPGGPGSMAQENWIQMNLPLQYTTFQQLPRNVVIAYMSNPEQGLCAVYLCVPDGSTDAGKVNHWAYHELLWKRAEDMDDTPPTPSFPPPAPDTDPEISIRPGVIEEQEDDASA